MANKILKVDETTILYGSEVGDDVAWSTESITDGNGRNSAFRDFGAGSTARSDKYMGLFFTQAQATATVGNTADVYWRPSDGTHPANDDGGDVALSAADKLKNLDYLGSAICDEAAANIEYTEYWHRLILTHRHGSPTLENNLGSTITTDPAETKFALTPGPLEVQ